MAPLRVCQEKPRLGTYPDHPVRDRPADGGIPRSVQKPFQEEMSAWIWLGLLSVAFMVGFLLGAAMAAGARSDEITEQLLNDESDETTD